MPKVSGIKTRAKILQPTPENLFRAAEALRQNAVVGMPTETVYGLAGNAFSEEALTQIFTTKDRPTFDPLIIHVGARTSDIQSLEQLQLVNPDELTARQYDQVEKLIHDYWPGPLTLVLPKNSKVPDLATSGLPTVAVRMPAHPVAQALIEAAGSPLAAPSANRFGRISPTTSLAVMAELGDRIDWILEGGDCQVGVESTIVGFSKNEEIILLRPGGIAREKLEATLGLKLIRPHALPPASHSSPLSSPGMLASHYAPRTPLRLLPQFVTELKLEDLSEIFQELNLLSSTTPIGLVLMSGEPAPLGHQLSQILSRPVIPRSLSISGNLNEAAQRLFSTLRNLDSQEVGLILAEPCLNSEGLGYAIMDRLKRASHRA